MHILLISRWFPYPPDNGSRIRVFNLVKQLSRRHQVSMVSFAEGVVSKERQDAMRSCCPVVQVVSHRAFRPGRLRGLLGFFSARPRSLIDTYSREMQAQVNSVCETGAVDVVVASQIDTTPYVLPLRNVPRVLEELELAVIHDRFALDRRPLARLRHGLTWWKLSRYVVRLLGEIDGCTVVSEPEQRLVKRVVPGCEHLVVVPNGVDLDTYTGDFGTFQPDSLIYTGALTYHANFDAMDFFLRDVFPLVRTRRPGAKLRITGGYSGVPIERLPLGGGAKLTGYLDDIRPAVAQSCACVVPLRVGGGTRLKVLEAMALGTPVIATSKGAEGLDAEHGKHILIADEPAAFADAVLRVLNDRDLRSRLAANGRRLVEERYSWMTCAQRLEQLLCQVAAEKEMRRAG